MTVGGVAHSGTGAGGASSPRRLFSCQSLLVSLSFSSLGVSVYRFAIISIDDSVSDAALRTNKAAVAA